ncbi:hypothetical protein ABI59_15605 [Acidobacteria bacterium Mor1]|nr:hypothetical protein ABI59_15605 [Acidobacteria bacterium Mor1]
MQPLRLELQGFTAFRDRTELDFTDADLFVLSGPTGSGKSSIIDAVTFALYGSIARYQNPNLVAPLISQGKSEARVRFDFRLDGRDYSAVRVVRRSKNRTSTREARLERDGETLAGNVAELDAAVRKLFGLTFDQFTTCVVLPQGEFARFLHESPRERQGLLKELLGIRVYDRMRGLAGARATELERRLAATEGRLEELLEGRHEDRETLEASVAGLSTLRERVREDMQSVDAAELRRAKLDRELEQADQTLAALERLEEAAGRAPVDEDALGEAARALDEAGRELEELDSREQEQRKALEGHRSEGELRSALENQERRERLEAMLAEFAGREDELAQALAEAAELQAAADRDRTRAIEAVEEIHRHHAAHRLAAATAPGDPCPVCRRTVEASIEPDPPEDLSKAEAIRDKAARRHDKATAAWERCAAERDRIAGRRAAAEEELEALPAAEDPEELAGEREARAEVEQALEQLTRRRGELREVERAARRLRETLDQAADAAWSSLQERRGAVAAMNPPELARHDPGESRQAIVDWVRETIAARKSERDKQAAARKKADTAAAKQRERIWSRCREAGLETLEDVPLAQIERRLGRLEQELGELERSEARRVALEKECATQKEHHAVAAGLARHLKADRFERWLLREAFERLAQLAGQRLLELSRGDYSLEFDEDQNVDVIDHRNAGERRSARTLSGGETFLASLALALSLSEQVAELAATGAARLESMFLDEGFGTLDPETLDTVAHTLEELGSRGRTVGLVTHVPDLAERIPVCFQVQKTPAGSRVERRD